MSLTQWLKSGKLVLKTPDIQGFPDPIDVLLETDSRSDALATQAANDSATPIIRKSQKRKRGAYSVYDDNTRAKIAKCAVDNGVAYTSRKFTTELGKSVSETSVRSMRDAYIKMKKSGASNLSSLPKSPRGNPLLLGKHDEDVQTWIKRVRVNGGVINNRIVMAGAEAIVFKLAKHKLEKCGGHIKITKSFAQSLLRRMGFVKRKGTKSIKKLPADFNEIREKFIEKVNTVVNKYDVPDSLVINWDQTGCHMVPGGEWTMEKKGAEQVSISGLDDKRQITVLLSITKSGSLLPPQLIYAGKSDRYLSKVSFPSDWDITYTDSHWSNEDSMIQFANRVIFPYVDKIRESLPLSQINQKAIALFDVYKAHRSEKLISCLKDHDVIPLFIPAACTDRLQPLDLTVNHEYKEQLKAKFHDWYSRQVVQNLEAEDAENVVVDMKTSVLKPIHAKWLIDIHDIMAEKVSLIQMGFRKVGLSDM